MPTFSINEEAILINKFVNYLAFLEIKKIKKKILGTDEKGPTYIIFISISYRPSQEYYMKKLLLHVTFAAYHHHPSNM